MRSLRSATSIVLAFVFAWWSPAAKAATCFVPSTSHPSIQAAVDDPACTQIMIAGGTFVESVSVDRSVVVTGGSSSITVIEGRVAASGSDTDINLNGLAVNAAAPSVAGCFPIALVVSAGATVAGTDLVVVNGSGDACLIFGDDFESGTTGTWSSTFP